jgi:Protein of unknown function (DUF559)
MSPAEQLIWARLRGRQVEGFKFRRQYGIGAFVKVQSVRLTFLDSEILLPEEKLANA